MAYLGLGVHEQHIGIAEDAHIVARAVFPLPSGRDFALRRIHLAVEEIVLRAVLDVVAAGCHGAAALKEGRRGPDGFAPLLGPLLESGVVADEVPATHGAGALEHEPLAGVDHVARGLSEVGALAFEEALVAEFAGYLEEFVEIGIKRELLAADDVVGQFLHLRVVATVQTDFGGHHPGRVGSDGADVLHLVGPHFPTVVHGELQIVEHVVLHQGLGRAGEVGLAVGSEDRHVAEGLRQPVIGVSPQNAHFALVGAVGGQKRGILGVGGVFVERCERGVGHLDDTIILVPHFVESPEGVVVLVIAEVDEQLLVVGAPRPHVVVAHDAQRQDDPVHGTGADFGVDARNGHVHVFQRRIVDALFGHAVLRVFIEKIAAGRQREGCGCKGNAIDVSFEFHKTSVL